MNRILAAALLLAALGCKKAEQASQAVDNAATQYVDGLQSNVQQAQAAAEKAAEAIAEEQIRQVEAAIE